MRFLEQAHGPSLPPKRPLERFRIVLPTTASARIAPTGRTRVACAQD
jgi:hypothetical protein